MVKTVSATEAKNRLGALLGDLGSSEDAVIVENRGVASAAIITMERFRSLQEYEEKERRAQVMEDFRRLRAEIAEQTKDMSEEELQAMIDEISSEINANLNAKYRARLKQLGTS